MTTVKSKEQALYVARHHAQLVMHLRSSVLREAGVDPKRIYFMKEDALDLWNAPEDLLLKFKDRSLASCPFCFVFDNNCNTCSYGKRHGICISDGSDFSKLKLEIGDDLMELSLRTVDFSSILEETLEYHFSRFLRQRRKFAPVNRALRKEGKELAFLSDIVPPYLFLPEEFEELLLDEWLLYLERLVASKIT